MIHLLLAAACAITVPKEVPQLLSGKTYPSLLENLKTSSMENWPSTDALTACADKLWESLRPMEKASLVLVASCQKEPGKALKLVRKGLEDGDPVVVTAALYGFRLAIGDAPPLGLSFKKLDRRLVTAVSRELYYAQDAIQREPLSHIWLDSLALTATGKAVLGSPYVLRRPLKVCLNGLDHTLEPEDAQAAGYVFLCLPEGPAKSGLLGILESLAMRAFKPVSGPPGRGWSPDMVRREAYSLATNWVLTRCSWDVGDLISGALRLPQGRTSDWWKESACSWWLSLYKLPNKYIWPLASRQLFYCGAPYAPISWRFPDSEGSRQARQRTLAYLEGRLR